jgi:hypothetical protein
MPSEIALHRFDGYLKSFFFSYCVRYHDPRGIFARNSMIREAVISLRSLFPNAPGEALLATVEIFSDASKGKCDLASAATALGDNPEIQSSLRSSNLESPWDAASVWRAKESTMAQANFIMRIVHFIEDKVRRTIAILSLLLSYRKYMYCFSRSSMFAQIFTLCI